MTSTPAPIALELTAETTARSGAVDGACEMCPHALSAHDAISLRFCSATLAAALTRGCVCPSS